MIFFKNWKKKKKEKKRAVITRLGQQRAAEAQCLGLLSNQDGCRVCFWFCFPLKPCFSQAELLQAEDLAIQFSLQLNAMILPSQQRQWTDSTGHRGPHFTLGELGGSLHYHPQSSKGLQTTETGRATAEEPTRSSPDTTEWTVSSVHDICRQSHHQGDHWDHCFRDSPLAVVPHLQHLERLDPSHPSCMFMF